MNSTPSPPIRQFEGDFLGDVDGFAVDLLIITIIITPEDERLVLVLLDLSGFDKSIFFCLDLLQKIRGRLIGLVLGDKLTPDGKIKDFLAQKFGVNHFSAPCAQ